MGKKRHGASALPKTIRNRAGDLQHAKQSTPAIQAFLMQNHTSSSTPTDLTAPIGDTVADQDEEANYNTPLEKLIADQGIQGELDPLLEAMADARHQAARLEVKTRQQMNITFCKCQADNVRLVQMGYIGATPVRPGTPFSIRLLQNHHVYWKYSTISTQAFALATDKLLDDKNPIIEIRQHEMDKLQLDALGRLAANCPRCFGPPVGVTQAEEPDIIVCQDGNFQHKRHAAASVEIPGYHPEVSELFAPPAEVEDMANELTRLSLPSNSRSNNNLDEGVAEKCLTRLLAINHQYTPQYFEAQWKRQKELQKPVINQRIQEKRDQLKGLLGFEEKSHETRKELELSNIRRASTHSACGEGPRRWGPFNCLQKSRKNAHNSFQANFKG
ncbi:hypothetical protein DFH28DRAFT_921373 [Melampsora americana]|nr:hypothetical protein DFH28DRAFT_921373 [Melampsora americana]